MLPSIRMPDPLSTRASPSRPTGRTERISQVQVLPSRCISGPLSARRSAWEATQLERQAPAGLGVPVVVQTAQVRAACHGVRRQSAGPVDMLRLREEHSP